MYDFFRFSDSRRARIAPLPPTATSADRYARQEAPGRKRPETVDDRVLCRAGSSMRCAVAVAGPGAPISTGRRRRSATASSAAPSALYGKVSSALRQAPRIRLTGCSSTAPASGFIAAPAAERGACPHCPHGIGRTEGGRNTGLHAVCDHKGRPVFLSIASCSRHPETCMIAGSHSAASRPCRHPPERVAGKGRDGRELRERLEERGTGPVIPPRKTRRIRCHNDRAVYRERNIIGRMFCRLKDRRRIATRFERNIKNVMAAIALAAALISWLSSPDPNSFRRLWRRPPMHGSMKPAEYCV